MKFARMLLALSLCLAVGALAGVLAYWWFGERQPGWILMTGALFAIIMANVLPPVKHP
jgi:uncharacterized membrane protein YccC